MIPLKLTLENFKCYRTGAPTLHLEGVHIACLCGGNGHGKSSLLDAMTWALWGDEVHRPQEELVHIGQQDMRVELEFMAGGRSEGVGGQRYRVLRRFNKGRGGRGGGTDLQLLVAASGQEGNDGQIPIAIGVWRSISGNVVRETQAQITRLVGMDYATFVNSAFLVQGRADEFTTKRPAERQRVLSRVLDLERYDRLQERAKEKGRERASAMQGLQGQVSAWLGQLAQRPEHEAELLRVATASRLESGQLEALERELAGLRESRQVGTERRRELEGLERQLQTAQEELHQFGGQRVQHRRRIQAWEALVAREEAIASDYARLAELRRRDEGLNRLVEPYGRLQERKRGIQQRIQGLPKLEAELEAAQRELEGLGVEVKALREKVEGLRLKRQEVQELASMARSAREELTQLQKQMDEHDKRVGDWQGFVAKESQINAAYEQLVRVRLRDEELAGLLEPYSRRQGRLQLLQRTAEGLPSLEAALLEAQSRLGKVEEREQLLQARQSELQELEVQRQTLEVENKRLHEEMDVLRGKVDMLRAGVDTRCPVCGTDLGADGIEHVAGEYESQGRAHAQGYRGNQAALRGFATRADLLTEEVRREQAALPRERRGAQSQAATLAQRVEEAGKAKAEGALIEWEIAQLGYDPGEHREVKRELSRLSQVEEAYRQLQEAMLGLPKERESLQRVTEMVERRKIVLATSEPRLKQIEREIADLPILERRLTQSEAQQGKLQSRTGTLSQQVEDARKAPSELGQVEQETAALGYDPAAHGEVIEAIKGLAKAEEEYRLLQEAVRGLPEEREALARVEGMMARRQEALTIGTERLAVLRQEAASLPVVEARLREAEARHAEGQAKHRQFVGRKGFLEERLREYDVLEQRKAEAETQLESLGRERQVYEDLAVAFGRTGVQALIIEAAIPQLEVYSNELLGRMTDNSMHLRLETQRETRQGGSAETLEIKVADTLGTRSYETFSGGEAFRINLALRIGLSKMLAHRAGAPLPTLFIDEGFGTQDAAGRERILDVINSIANDFECILVITHMEEVKDVFPVRIEVQKTEAGSTFVMA